MAKYSNTVEYNIKTTLDMTGISKLRAELQQLSNFVSKRGNQKLLGDINAPAILKDIKSIESAINKAFNPKLGMLNASQFNRALTASGLNAQTLYNKLSSLGPVGQRTFNSLAAQMGKIDIGMRNVSSTTDKIMNTLGNTVRWGLIASGFSQVMNAAHQATQYVKDLDKSLTNIMMVSGETRDNMNEFAKSANEVAQRLGATTVQMTDAAKVFVQQGMTLNQSQQMGEYAVHLANISEQDSATTSDELTAMKNAFKLNIDDMGNAISKWAAIANNTAVDMEELSVASQKAASVANTVGVDMEQFAGHIAAIEATTREAPENIGNGLKTLYSRFADIKLGETLEDGVDLGQFSSALEKVGVSVLDTEGKMRDVGAIMEDMMAKWQDLDKTERNAVATTVAGRFQLARFEALMNSQDIYKNAVSVARNEQGTETYDRMQEIYRDSLEGRSKALQSKVEELFLNIFNSDSFNGAIDALSGFVDILNDLIESVGGGTAALTALSAILLKIGNTAISRGISNFISNRQADRRANENIKYAEEQAKRTAGMYGINGSTQEQQSFIDSMAAVSRNSSLMTAEEIRLYNQGIEEQAGLLNEASAAQETYKSNIEAIRGALESQNLITKDSDAAILGYVETMELMGNTLTIDSAKYKEAQEGLVKLGQEFAKYHAQAQRIINTNEQIVLTEEQITNVATINTEAFETLKTTLSEWIASGRFAGTTTRELEKILGTLNAALEAQSKIVEGNQQSIENAAKAWQKYLSLAPRVETLLGNVSSSMAILNKDIQKNATSARNASTAYITANSQAGAIQGSRERTAEQLKTRKITEDIINLGQATTTAVFALQSLSGIFSTLSDDSLTVAEKVEHVALNFGMVAAMGIPAITQVKEAFSGLSNQIKITGQNWSVLLEQKDALSAFNIYKDMGQASIPYITNINTGQITRPVEVVNAIEAEINSGKILNETLIKEIALKNDCSAADVKRVAQAMNLAAAEELVANNIKGKNIAEQLNLKIMNGKYAAYLKATGAVLLYESGLTGMTAAELMATEGAVGLMVALTPIIAAAAGLIAIVSIVNSISEAEEKRKERLQATIDANNEAVTAIKENREELQSLYAEYQETGEASDEFKQKLQEQADTLGVVGANIDILLGRYDDLIEKLDTASNSQLNYNNILLDKQNQDLYTEDAFGSLFYNIQGVSKYGLSYLGTPFRPGGESLRLTGAQTYSQELQLNKIVDLQNDATQKQQLAETQLSELLGSEPIDRMSKEWEEWNEQVKSVNEELWKLDLILDDINKQSDLYSSNVLDEANSQAKENWINQIDNEWLQQFTDKNSWLNQNSVASIDELNNAITEGKLGKHIQEYFDVLNEIDPAQAKAKLIEYAQQIVDSDVENQFTDSGLKLQGALIAGLTDDDGNFNTELYDKVVQKFSFFNDEQIEKFANYLNRDWENEDLTQFLENFVTATNVDTSSISNLILLIGQINPSNWTNLFSLLGGIFQNGNGIADFFKQFADWDITEKARALGDFNLTTEKLNTILERLNISQEELDQYQKDLINTTPKLKKRFNDLTAEYEKYVKEHKENTAEGKRAKQALDSFNASMQDMTATLLKQKQGLSDFTEQWEDISEKISNTDPAIRLEGINELRPILEDITNLDLSGVNADLLVTEENLNLMAEAANGDGEAMQNLIRNLDESYLVSIGITEDGQNLPAEMQNILDQVQAAVNNTELEVGTSLDNEPFIEGLRQMLQSTQYTAEQINAFFTAVQNLGIEFNLDLTDIVNALSTLESKAASLNTNTIEGAITSGAFAAIGEGLRAEATGRLTATKTGDISGLGNSLSNGGSGGSGGSGGGGGGSGKTYTPKTKDPIEEEIDRYEKVNTALNEVDSQINKLTVDQDRLIGNNWIKNLEKETGLLQEQIPLYQEKLQIQKQEAEELQKQLATDYGAQFNDLGLLQNYAAIHKQLEQEVNNLIAQYNAATTEDEQNALEKKIEAAQDRLDKFKTAYQRYDTLVSKDMIETQKQLEEIKNRLEDIRYEAFKARKEAAEELKDLRDDRRDFNENLATLFEDDPLLSLSNAMGRFKDLFDADEAYIADAISLYKKKMAEATSDDMKKFYQAQIDSLEKAQQNGTSVLDLNSQRLDEILNEYQKWLNGEETDWSEEDLWAAMQDAFQDAVELAEDLKKEVDNIHNKISDIFDKVDDLTEKRKEQFDAIQEELEYTRDMAELLYGDQAYAWQTRTYNLEAQNGQEKLKTLEATRAAYHEIVEATKNNAAAQEEYQMALEKEQELDKEILDTRKEITQAYKDAKDAANNLAVQNWVDQFEIPVNGVKVPLQYAQEAWERIKENADVYLDELNRAWEVEKLQNKYLELINNNTDPTLQKQITDQMNQQLEYLRDKNNLSRYDVEYANAQLEILQKTIALEDARNNKNQMRLRRDTQGNYSYVYAASQENIAEAENDLLDSQMNGYNISVEANRNSADSFFQKIQNMADQLRNVANDATLSEEQISAITADIIENGYEYLDAMGEQLTTAQQNMIESFIQAAQNLAAENNQAVQIIADELINSTDATVDMISDKFVSGIERMVGPDGMALFRDEADQARDDIINNVEDFEQAISDANTNIADPLDEIDTNVKNVQNSISNMADEAQRFYGIIENHTGVITQAAGELAEYQAKLTDAQNELSVYSQRVNQLGKDLETQKTINTQLSITNTNLQRQIDDAKKKAEENARKGKGGSGSGGGRNPSEYEKEGIAAAIWNGNYGWGAGDERRRKLEEKGFSYSEIQSIVNIGYERANAWVWKNGWPDEYAYWKYDTGGYTGDWGTSDGKVAMLHQKELVLNSADTENMLAAVSVVREIVNQLKGSIQGINLMNSLSSLGQTTMNDTIEQRVDIQATFPNATSAKEIEDAFMTIANTSYQYAYNKNK